MALSVAVALAIVWAAIALSYRPTIRSASIVGTLGAAAYTIGRAMGRMAPAHLRAGAGHPHRVPAVNTPGLDWASDAGERDHRLV